MRYGSNRNENEDKWSIFYSCCKSSVNVELFQCNMYILFQSNNIAHENTHHLVNKRYIHKKTTKLSDIEI